MVLFIAQYLLAGLIVSFILEHVIRFTDQTLNWKERYSMVVLWPIMVAVFVIYFIKGLLED